MQQLILGIGNTIWWVIEPYSCYKFTLKTTFKASHLIGDYYLMKLAMLGLLL